MKAKIVEVENVLFVSFVYLKIKAGKVVGTQYQYNVWKNETAFSQEPLKRKKTPIFFSKDLLI